MKTLFYFFLLHLVFSCHANAGEMLKINLENKNLTASQNANYQKFLSYGQSLIPKTMKNVLSRDKITLTFEKIGDQNNLTILDSSCKTKQEGAKKEPLFHSGKSSSSLFSNNSVTLNEAFWPEIQKDPAKSIKYNCGHRTGYRLAVATLLHELGHLYDRQIKISSDRRFLHLMTFAKGFFSTSQKNTISNRSPDDYEYTSPKEAFAVNLEYFLMDPEYKCRRPTLYEYFKEKLQHTPFRRFSCQINTQVKVQDKQSRITNLDLNRLYRVDYLLADKGTDIESRFGHSMLRLIFCAPEHEKSILCEQDTKHHIVVSFRASVIDKRDAQAVKKDSKLWDPILHYLKGLGIAGHYPSEMYLMSFEIILAEYNSFDYRNLLSIPLNLSLEEKRDLLNRVLEINWGYSGSYQFFTNNCKTETEDLLKSVLRGKNIEKINAYTPVGLREELYEAGLVMVAKTSTDDREKVFKSQHYNDRDAANEIKKFLEKNDYTDEIFSKDPTGIGQFIVSTKDFSKAGTMESFIEKFDAAKRQKFIEYVEENFKTYNKPLFQTLLRNFLTFELGASDYDKMNLFFTVKSIEIGFNDEKIENYEEYLDKNDLPRFKKELEEWRASFKIHLETAPLAVQGYGVPQGSDQITGSKSLSPQISEFLTEQIQKIQAKATLKFQESVQTSGRNIQLILQLLGYQSKQRTP